MRTSDTVDGHGNTGGNKHAQYSYLARLQTQQNSSVYVAFLNNSEVLFMCKVAT